MMKQADYPDFAIVGGMVFVECTARFKPVQFMFDNKWITIDP